jgi:hypothetical protein
MHLQQVHCQWNLQQSTKDPTFIAKILFTDESCFTRVGITNSYERTCVVRWNSPCDSISPSEMTVLHRRPGWKFRWCLIGPHISPAGVSGCDYLNFVRTHLSALLEDVSFNTHLHVWFQHDGVPTHYSREMRQWLSEYYPARWIGRGDTAPVSRPAHSPDLNPLNFLFSVTIFENRGLCQHIRY